MSNEFQLPTDEIAKKAKEIRKKIIRMNSRAGQGHTGADLSETDILATLFFRILNIRKNNLNDPNRDRFILSKGHGVGGFYCTLAEADYYDSELEREQRHIKQVPKLEREEVRHIYQQKVFQSELLERIVETITANPDVWVAVMMAEEHQLTPVDRRQSWKVALVVGISAIIGSLIPLIPFIFLPIGTSMWVSVAITALVLFIVGGYKARMTVGHPGRSGLEMAVIGTLSALAGFIVGILLKVPTSS